MKTIELVLIGHPDKVCDGIAEQIKSKNPNGRNAIEVVWFNNHITVGGETDKEWDDMEVRFVVSDYLTRIIGITLEEIQTLEIENRLNVQSAEINAIVGQEGAGDNGIFFGGWDSTYSPVIFGLKKLCMMLNAPTLAEIGYRTDGKLIADIQDDGSISRLVLNIASFENKFANFAILTTTILTFAAQLGLNMTGVHINPKGNWHKCFGFADSGLTGRKLACDTQCGLFHNGGGAWFGKDFSKADFSVPVYLTIVAKKTCEQHGIDCLELSANTIIGDTQVMVENCSDKIGTLVDYEHMVDFAKKQKIDILGGIDFGGAK